ncbi:3-deoxy-7-phosphoheptulonate synthase [Candidatus Woesearchaeota archaeon]|nr:3-deoxy-7-phosphoheptulonate synthase [Candidatus Woesearchaeota archaeon]
MPEKYLHSRKYQKTDSIIDINGIKIGGKEIVVMAGPCSVESKKVMIETAEEIKKKGAKILRGGAFKPRTSPYSFQGSGEKGLKILSEAREKTGLPIVSEVMDTKDVSLVEKYVDVIQVGARNMQNFNLLKAVGRTKKPVLLKRGLSATLKEFLMAAEYIMKEGNKNVILCERGIRTFVEYSRNTLDLNIIPALKKETHLPVIVDPSHGTGIRDFVIPMSKAAIAAGADGLIVEVHPKPAEATSDKDQTIDFDQFGQLMKEIKKVAEAVGRKAF